MTVELAILALVAIVLAGGWINAELENRELRDELADADADLDDAYEALNWPAAAGLERPRPTLSLILGDDPSDADLDRDELDDELERLVPGR